ncbi:hypothetical protein [Micrococcus luteus]|uniref:hypothetical protein n=1 Tax=Micrococcus luteus TaxID=1270 RepID=UPI00100B90E2|nr:hypothetical protein [Micrococcus luteus]
MELEELDYMYKRNLAFDPVLNAPRRLSIGDRWWTSTATITPDARLETTHLGTRQAAIGRSQAQVMARAEPIGLFELELTRLPRVIDDYHVENDGNAAIDALAAKVHASEADVALYFNPKEESPGSWSMLALRKDIGELDPAMPIGAESTFFRCIGIEVPTSWEAPEGCLPRDVEIHWRSVGSPGGE